MYLADNFSFEITPDKNFFDYLFDETSFFGLYLKISTLKGGKQRSREFWYWWIPNSSENDSVAVRTTTF